MLVGIILLVLLPVDGLLYRQSNEVRSIDTLDGLWTFVREEPSDCYRCISMGQTGRWFDLDLSTFKNSSKIPVPSAYNELFAEREVREHVGWVWYQRIYRLSRFNLNSRLILRFGSVQYRAKVYVNSNFLIEHIGGHLPFQVELPSSSNQLYRITVAVDNILHSESIPPGSSVVYNYTTQNKSGTVIQQIPNFDFFNYAGILRSVEVQILEQVYVESLYLTTKKPNILNYHVQLSSSKLKPNGQQRVILCLIDDVGNQIECVNSGTSFSPVENVKLWWPREMGDQPLYTLEVSVYFDTQLVDIYRETFGFRWVTLKNGRIYINDEPFYCQGFGMHEDFYIHGRGFDPIVMTRDLNMFEWMNANCYRTSHYPYSEERAYEADRRGIVVITEVPAVGIFTYNNNTKQLHKQMIRDMIFRDYNHPSVIAWSLSNEPVVDEKPACVSYFKEISDFARKLDPNRPISVVFGSNGRIFSSYGAAANLDLIGVNTYPGWYHNPAILETVEQELNEVLASWPKYHPNKTFILTEYGAEALPGYNAEPSIIFSEQYQIDVLKRVHIALDSLRQRNVISGEMLWNFADFMTATSLTRPFGNHKGVLTRDRQPKASAYLMKERYAKLTRKQCT